jgi:hypothetical protein
VDGYRRFLDPKVSSPLLSLSPSLPPLSPYLHVPTSSPPHACVPVARLPGPPHARSSLAPRTRPSRPPAARRPWPLACGRPRPIARRAWRPGLGAWPPGPLAARHPGPRRQPSRAPSRAPWQRPLGLRHGLRGPGTRSPSVRDV